MSRVLVTGGSGFLGSHLCEYLLNEGNEVICLDNFFSGNKNNIRHLLKHDNFELIRHDVQNPILLQIDQIYHLACPASPCYYQYSSIDTMKTSVIGTLNMLELARKTGSRFLLASTSEIYGNPSIHPQTEDYWGNVNSIGIRSCYDEGKRAAETLTMDYYRTYGVDVRIARIFNSYGPNMNQNDGRVVSNFIVQALKGDDITVYGKGDQTRSFCYCLDTIDGLYKLMNQEFIGPMNIGNPVETTIIELASTIIDIIKDTKSKIVYKPLPSDDPTRRLPNIDKARALLNWEAKVSLHEGLSNTIKYFKFILNEFSVTNQQIKKLEKIQQVTKTREIHEEALRKQRETEKEIIKQFKLNQGQNTN